MLLEIAQGDAYGRPFEFNTPEFIKANNDVLEFKLRDNEIDKPELRGKYTDDAAMSLGIAEALLEDLPISQEDYAQWFVRVDERDKRDGYSKRVKNALVEAASSFVGELGSQRSEAIARIFLAKVNPKGAPGNGAVMRALPIGLLSDPNEVVRQSILHASATHGSMASMEATTFTALTAHWYYHLYDKDIDVNESKQAYFTWITKILGFGAIDNIMNRSWDGASEIPCEARATAAAALAIVWEYPKMSEILKASIDFGGDVDSVAAVALGLASLKGSENDLPKTLYDGLEDGLYGRTYLEDMDRMLFKKFPKNVTV